MTSSLEGWKEPRRVKVSGKWKWVVLGLEGERQTRTQRQTQRQTERKDVFQRLTV